MRKEIAKENLSKFKAKMNPIIKKALALGLTPPAYSVVREFEREFNNGGKKWFEPYVELEIEAAEVKLSGWQFVATIDHRPNGNILRCNPKYEGAASLSDYYTSTSHCDHCSHQRKRNNTYLMANESGEVKQVGSSCIKDFVGHPSAEYYAQLYEYLWSLEKEEKDLERSFRNGREAFNVTDLLEAACLGIRLYGYRSAKMGGATTANFVKNYMSKSSSDWKKELNEDKPSVTEADKKAAQEALELAKSFTEEERRNAFTNNLATLASSEYVFWQDIGMLCYLPEMNMKTMAARMERERQIKEAAQSNFVGEVGKRETFVLTHLKTVHLADGMFRGQGSYRMYIFKAGNDLFIWKTSNDLPDSESGQYELTGTIKAHNLYNNVKQTELTRCKVKVSKAA